MVKELLAPFAHRHNQDDTWDSICSKCFLVVATEENEEELREHETESRLRCPENGEAHGRNVRTNQDAAALKFVRARKLPMRMRRPS